MPPSLFSHSALHFRLPFWLHLVAAAPACQLSDFPSYLSGMRPLRTQLGNVSRAGHVTLPSPRVISFPASPGAENVAFAPVVFARRRLPSTRGSGPRRFPAGGLAWAFTFASPRRWSGLLRWPGREELDKAGASLGAFLGRH